MTNENAKKNSTPPYLSQCKLSPFSRIYHVSTNFSQSPG
jgi:hypothetical protein